MVWKRANCQLEKEKEFRQWIKRPEVRDELFPKLKGGLTEETMREMMEAAKLL
jgi:hypothetical protein